MASEQFRLVIGSEERRNKIEHRLDTGCDQLVKAYCGLITLWPWLDGIV
ncbi:hypothetical protein GcM3_025048, partial [Golovinomyces cichoracearum]